MTLAIIFESVGAGEWLVLLAVVLIVVGPRRLPETARKFGQHYAKFRRAAESFKRQLLEMDTEINNAVAEAENAVNEAEKEVEAAAKDVDPDLVEPDPVEFNGSDDGYTDYGGYDPEVEVESAKAEPPEAESVKPEPAKPANGIKITVSPAPSAVDSTKMGA